MRLSLDYMSSRFSIFAILSAVVAAVLMSVLVDEAAAQRFRRQQRSSRSFRSQSSSSSTRTFSSNPPAALPNSPARGSTSTIRNLAGPDSPAPDLWKVKVDPPAEPPAAITQDVLLPVPPSFFGGEVVYPTGPSV
ncbi:MAG: hypothetical protein ACP5XB_09975, partial [Isosphaeraceae bacterium]